MLVPHRKKSLSIFFILLILAIPFTLAYYHSATSKIKPYQVFREKHRDQMLPSVAKPRSKLPSGQLLLKKNEKVVMKKTCLVFKGFSKGRVILDFYLLELDPKTPYVLNFTKESVSDGIWLDNVQYKLVSVSENTLRLKIQDSYSTL